MQAAVSRPSRPSEGRGDDLRPLEGIPLLSRFPPGRRETRHAHVPHLRRGPQRSRDKGPRVFGVPSALDEVDQRRPPTTRRQIRLHRRDPARPRPRASPRRCGPPSVGTAASSRRVRPAPNAGSRSLARMRPTPPRSGPTAKPAPRPPRLPIPASTAPADRPARPAPPGVRTSAETDPAAGRTRTTAASGGSTPRAANRRRTHLATSPGSARPGRSTFLSPSSTQPVMRVLHRTRARDDCWWFGSRRLPASVSVESAPTGDHPARIR
jgi:hypothetical protein